MPMKTKVTKDNYKEIVLKKSYNTLLDSISNLFYNKNMWWELL